MAGFRPSPAVLTHLANERNRVRDELNRKLSELAQAEQAAYDAGTTRPPSREELDAQLDALAPLADRYDRLEAMCQAIGRGEWHAAG